MCLDEQPWPTYPFGAKLAQPPNHPLVPLSDLISYMMVPEHILESRREVDERQPGNRHRQVDQSDRHVRQVHGGKGKHHRILWVWVGVGVCVWVVWQGIETACKADHSPPPIQACRTVKAQNEMILSWYLLRR